MKVSALTILHYGLDYVPYALLSVEPLVDEIIISYTPHPSHGHITKLQPPESREDLYRAVVNIPKVKWHDVNQFWMEGQHRDHALSLCSGDLVVVADSDEVWDTATLEKVIKFASDGSHRNTLVGCLTPWRSFNWLCRDDMQPVRVIKPSGQGDAAYPLDAGRFWHFGYAVKDIVLAYKMSIHGHFGEWRPNWLEEKWKPWPPVQDVHPTGCGPWNPEPFDKMKLPEIMRGHLFWDMDKIE